MAIDFPANPTVGQAFTVAGALWTWDGVKWTASSIGQPYLPLVGGTLTGNLAAPTLSASDGVSAPVAKADPPLGDNDQSLATTAWVNANTRLGDNRIINGDMRIFQRSPWVTGSMTGTYTVDRWIWSASVAGKGNWVQATVALPGFPNAFQYTSSSAYTPAAADVFELFQGIEADMVSDFAWGTASAQPVTLSFWVYSSSVAGPFSGAITNWGGTRSYPFTYPVPAIGTWTKVIVNIPGDTAGTWVMGGNAGSFTVQFDLGSGANYRTTAGGWVSGNYVGVTGTARIISTNGAQFFITGVKLEIGSIATPYNRQSLAKSLADCQRYYFIMPGPWYAMGWAGTGGGSIGWPVTFPVPMRIAPPITQNFTGNNANVSGVTQAATTTSVYFVVTPTAAPGFIQLGGGGAWVFAANAEL